MRFRVRTWFVSLIVAVLLALLVLHLIPEDKRLEKRASRVVRTTGWFTATQPAYRWLSDHTLLALRNVPQQQSQVVFNMGKNGPAPAMVPSGGGELFKYDIKTGQASPLVDLTRAFKHTNGDAQSLSFSADGRAVLWGQPDDGSATAFGAMRPVFGMIVDGGKRVRWTADGGAGGLWRPDNRSWLQFHYDPGRKRLSQVTVYSMDRPDKPILIPVPAGSPVNKEPVCWFFGSISQAGTLLVDTWDNSVKNLQRTSVDVFELRFGNELQLIRTFHIQFPGSAQLNTRTFSPRGDQVAWLFNMDRKPQLPRILEPLRHVFGMDAHLAESIWVSGVDGSNMREIAYRLNEGSGDEGIWDIHWMPNQTHLSLRVGDWIWKLPVN